MPTDRSTIHADDDRVRVTSWTFEDGEDAGHHRHELDYVVVPVTGGKFAIVDPGGETSEMTQEAAILYRGRAGTEHNVINRSGRTAVFVEIELKR